ncbi:MAG: glycosyltransferase family 4 protein [Acidimicrobiales bacterium]
MRRVGVVVKYYPPLERVSGIIGFLRVLDRALAGRCELHVITSRSWGDDKFLTLDGHAVHRCAGIFPVAAGHKARSLDLDGIVFVSGIYDQRKAAPYVEAFSLALRRSSARRIFLQATHVDGRGNRFFVRALSRFESVLATSTSLRDQLAGQLGRPVGLLLPGVDVPDQATESEGLTIGFVNHLNRVKGADIALDLIRDALDREPRLTAIIAGTGEFEEEARHRFEGDERVTVKGFLDEVDLLETLGDCDIMLLPFRTGVSVLGISQTALEVMAAGNVVIGSDVAPLAEAVEHDVTGLLGPVDGLGELLRAVLDDDERRRALGTAARDDVLRRWNIQDRAEQVVALFDGSGS